MSRRPRARTVAPVLVALCTSASVPVSADTLPIQVETRRIASNGLRVVLSPDHTAPTVAVAVYYDVGARVEQFGHTGFAHLFEHMMFEGSANVGKGEHFRLIGQHGGDFNGTTSEDRTNYYETLPASALSLGLWLEADRMRSLAITEENFENQRATVMEERRQSYENRPYMSSILARDSLSYGEYFPYAHSVIGDMSDLQHASLAEVRAFHDTYYAPNNAVVSIAGDIEPDAAMALVERYFGTIPRHETPAYDAPAIASQTAERTGVVHDPLAPLPAFHLVYHIPARRTPDHYALEILSTILGDGESSRLYQLLVKDREVTSAIEVTTEDRRGPDIFTFYATLTEGHTPEQVRPMVYEVIDAIAQHGVTGRELEKAKNRSRSAFIFGLQSNMQRAQHLGEFEVYDGNARLLLTEPDHYTAVTMADVQRVAREYLAASNRTVLDVLPGAHAPGDASEAPMQPHATNRTTAPTGGAR